MKQLTLSLNDDCLFRCKDNIHVLFNTNTKINFVPYTNKHMPSWQWHIILRHTVHATKCIWLLLVTYFVRANRASDT